MVVEKLHKIKTFETTTEQKQKYIVQTVRAGGTVTLSLGTVNLVLTPTEVLELRKTLLKAESWRAGDDEDEGSNDPRVPRVDGESR